MTVKHFWCKHRLDYIALAVTLTLLTSLFGWPWGWGQV